MQAWIISWMEVSQAILSGVCDGLEPQKQEKGTRGHTRNEVTDGCPPDAPIQDFERPKTNREAVGTGTHSAQEAHRV